MTRAPNYGNVFDRLLRIEEEHELFDWTVNGVYVWERIRSPIYEAVVHSCDGEAHQPRDPSLLDRIQLAPRLGLNAICEPLSISSPAPFLFWGWQRRKRLEDGLWWDLICDPVLEDLSAQHNYLEPDYRGRHFKPAKTENLYHLDSIRIQAYLRRVLGLVSVSVRGRDRRKCRAIQEAISHHFDVEVDVLRLVQGTLAERESSIGLYTDLLANADPEAVVLVGSDSNETFIEACQRHGVPAVELQHGFLGPRIPSYSYPGDRCKRRFADRFFTFGDFWKEAIDFPIPQSNVESMGYPFLEIQRQRYQEVPQEDRVLVVSQSDIGEELGRFAAELDMKISEGWTVDFKLHPAEYHERSEKYSWLSKTGVNLLEGEIPLHKLLARSRAQVGVYSTVLFEGLCFGLDTFLVNLPGIRNMDFLLKEGAASLVETPDECVERLQRDALTPVDTDYLFRPGAKERIQERLLSIAGVR